MSPYKARARVLGIGVADIARTCGAIMLSPFEESSDLADSSFKLAGLKYN